MRFLNFFSNISKSTKFISSLQRNLNSLENLYSNTTDSETSPSKDALEKYQYKISKSISSIHQILSAQSTIENGSEALGKFCQELFQSGVLVGLISNLDRLCFESQKVVGYILKNLLGRHEGPNNPTVVYISDKPEILYKLMDGYEQPGLCNICGPLLLECAKFESLAREILYSDQFGNFFSLTECEYFEVASSAMSAIKALLSKNAHKKLVSDFLIQYYDVVIHRFTSQLMVSQNYYTKREGIKLLGEILLNQSNYKVLHRFISSASNLKLIMRLLVNKSLAIQYEAFHVFKAFFSILDEERVPGIHKILFDNKAKLIEFLHNFQRDDTELEDDHLFTEKAYIIQRISQLEVMNGISDINIYGQLDENKENEAEVINKTNQHGHPSK